MFTLGFAKKKRYPPIFPYTTMPYPSLFTRERFQPFVANWHHPGATVPRQALSIKVEDLHRNTKSELVSWHLPWTVDGLAAVWVETTN